MNENLDRTISDLMKMIETTEGELAENKRVVNRLCKMNGRQPVYAESAAASGATINSIRRDQWYGQPISTAIREYLTMRRVGDQGPGTVNEIYDALIQGGFRFETKDDENAKRALRISLTKNTSIFHRMPDGKTYGLLEWYPDVKVRKEREPTADAKELNGDDSDLNVRPLTAPKEGDS